MRNDTFVANRLLEILRNRIPGLPQSVSETLDLRASGADSLAIVEILLDLKEEFDVDVRRDRWGSIRNIRDLLSLIAIEKEVSVREEPTEPIEE